VFFFFFFFPLPRLPSPPSASALVGESRPAKVEGPRPDPRWTCGAGFGAHLFPPFSFSFFFFFCFCPGPGCSSGFRQGQVPSRRSIPHLVSLPFLFPPVSPFPFFLPGWKSLAVAGRPGGAATVDVQRARGQRGFFFSLFLLPFPFSSHLTALDVACRTILEKQGYGGRTAAFMVTTLMTGLFFFFFPLFFLPGKTRGPVEGSSTSWCFRPYSWKSEDFFFFFLCRFPLPRRLYALRVGAISEPKAAGSGLRLGPLFFFFLLFFFFSSFFRSSGCRSP